MIKLEETLKLKRCPHCSVDNPNLVTVFNEFSTSDDNNETFRYWRIYRCMRCGGIVTAYCLKTSRVVQRIFPNSISANEILPVKVKSYLQQAIDCVYAPAGSVMLCASAVDAMLKEKGYKDGNLYPRINKAMNDGLLTPDMAKWAHQVRLEANEQRHSDTDADLPTIEDANQSIEFTKTLAEILFVLPNKVEEGIKSSLKQEPNPGLESKN